MGQRTTSIILGFLLILTFTVLFRIDASMTPLSPSLTPDAFNTERNTKLPVVLVSYADGPQVFYKNQNGLVASAADKGFDRIYNYHRNDIDPDFYRKNSHILMQKRGAGYWLWKPYFIWKTMQEVPDGALIFYADSGLIFKKSLDPLLEVMQGSDLLTLTHGKSTPIKRHLKKEAYAFFDFPLTEKILNSENIWGFLIIVRNTPEARRIIKIWLDTCQKAEALTDTPFDAANQDSQFDYHQHDQSILSIIIAQYPDRVKLIRRNEMRKIYGIQNFHRHKEQEWTSPLWIQANFPVFLSDLVWNNYLFQIIRKHINSDKG